MREKNLVFLKKIGSGNQKIAKIGQIFPVISEKKNLRNKEEIAKILKIVSKNLNIL